MQTNKSAFLKAIVLLFITLLAGFPAHALESQALLQQWLEQPPADGFDATFYRTLPQIQRKLAQEKSLLLLQTEKVAPFRQQLLLGMGLSGSEVFFNKLLAEYPQANLTTKETILEALFLFAHRTPLTLEQKRSVEPLLEGVFARSSYVTTAQSFVEAGLLLAGKVDSEKSRALLSQFFADYAASDLKNLLFLFRDQNRDRLFGTLALALGFSALGPTPVYQRFMGGLEKAPLASIFAARALYETGKSEAYQACKPLLYNAAVKTDIRLLTARWLPGKMGVDILKNFDLKDGMAKRLQLGILQSAALQLPAHQLQEVALKLLTEEDLGLRTEGLLILARSKNRSLKGPLQEALEQKSDLLTRILLAYASEEIELS